MTNAEKFLQVFGFYATEMWAKPENDFLEWLNLEYGLSMKYGKRNWRNDPITSKQMFYINNIEQIANTSGVVFPNFTGTTKGEASDHISKCVDIIHEMNEYYDEVAEIQAILHEDAGDRI